MKSISSTVIHVLGAGALLFAAPAAYGAIGFVQNPGTPIGENTLGLEDYQAGRYDEAIEHYERSLAIRGSSQGLRATVSLNLALAYECAGQRGDALEAAMRSAKGQRHRHLHFYLRSPVFADMRTDARFEPIRLELERARERDIARTSEEMLVRRLQLDRVRRQYSDSTILWQDGHSDRITALAFSPSGDRLVSTGYDRTVRLWSTHFDETPRTLDVYSRLGVRLEYSAAGDLILVHDGETLEARLYDGRSGERRLSLETKNTGVLSAAFAGEDRLWAVTLDGQLQRWNTARGSVERKVSLDVPVETVTASADTSRLLALCEDMHVRLCDGETGEVLREFGPDRIGVWHADFLPDGRLRLHCADDRDYIYAADGSGKPVVMAGRNDLLNNIPSRDGRRVLARDAEGTLVLLDTITGEPVSEDSESDVEPGEVVAARFSQQMQVYDARTGVRLGWVQSVSNPETIARSSDGRFAVGHRDGIFLCDAAGHGRELISHAGRLQSISIGADERIAVGLGGYRMIENPPGPWAPDFPPRFPASVRVWDLSTGEEVDVLDRTLSSYVRYAPDGVTLGVGSPYGCSLVLPDGSRQPLAGKSRAALRFSPDGERSLVTVPYQRGAVLSDSGGKVLGRINGLAQVGFQSDQCQARFSPDGFLVVTAQEGGDVLISDGSDASEIIRLEGHSRGVTEFAFDPTGTRLASSSDDATVRVWDFESMEPIAELKGHEGRVWCCAFNADGTVLASAGIDGTVRLWDPETGEQQAQLEGHTDVVRWVGFHPTSGQLLSTSFDGTARLWDVEAGAEVTTLVGHTGSVDQAAFTEDGRIVTWANDAAVRVWSSDGRLLATHIEYDGGGWLTFEPGGRYVAGGNAEEWARAQVDGATYPLSSYAGFLRDPKAVKDALAGNPPSSLPVLPSAPSVFTTDSETGDVDERLVRLELTILDEFGIEEVTLERNGARWPEDGELTVTRQPQGRRPGFLELAVPFDDEQCELTVRVTNKRGVKSVPLTVQRTYVPPVGDLRILTIAVTDYDDDDYDLAAPKKDALAIAERFKAEAGGLYRDVLVHALFDAEVTQERLYIELEEFLEESAEEDTVLVFVAGHGARTGRDRYFFLPPGATPKTARRGIPRSVIEDLVFSDKIEAGRRVLLLDTCHAGKEIGEGARGVGRQDSFLQEEVDAYVGTGIYVVAGSTEFGTAQETLENGVFTRALLDGLDGDADARDGGDRNGTVDILELITYASRVVRESPGVQRVTTPDIQGGNAFPLARRAK